MYKTDWRDNLRHVANVFFVCSYLCLERGHLVVGAMCTFAGETMLAPSAIKHRSWSTVAVGAMFMVLALATLTRSLL